jgi:hypothetical protein
MVGLGLFDPLSRRFGIDIQRDGYDFEALGVKLVAQRLPHGQVKAASSP